MVEEALDKFYVQDVMPQLEQALSALEEVFQQNKASLKEKFITEFKDICINIKKVQNEKQKKTGYIMFNLLRTNILQHKYGYKVVVYDQNWYMSDEISVGELDVGFFYQYFEELWQKLLKEYRKYIMKISEPDVERLLFNHLDDFHKYVVELMRYSLIDAIETKEYRDINKEETMEIQAGEYYEPCDIIHKELKEKNEKKIRKWLENSEEKSYLFEDFRKIELKNLIGKHKDLRYSDFRESQLDGSDISTSLLIGTKFKNSSMRGVNLMVSMINDANFEYADLTEADLQYCVAFTGKNQDNQWKKTGFTGVSFKNSVLKKANFTGATIIDGNFLGADLTETIFEEATLYRSKFSKEQLKSTKFTEKQLEQIEIIE